LLPVAGVGGIRPRLGRVARVRHDLRRTPITAGPAPQHARPANPTAATEFGTTHRNRPGTNRFHSHRVASQMQASGTDIRHFYTAPGTPPGELPPGSLGVPRSTPETLAHLSPGSTPVGLGH